jgi:hypothetical protein
METIHRFKGQWGKTMNWEWGRSRSYNGLNGNAVVETSCIGKIGKVDNFAVRYNTAREGGNTTAEKLNLDHGMTTLTGSARDLSGGARHGQNQGDVIYNPPDVCQQIANHGKLLLSFICGIPAHRAKKGIKPGKMNGLILIKQAMDEPIFIQILYGLMISLA